MQQITDSFAANPALLVGLVVGSLGVVGCALVVWMIASATVRNAREREQTRREVAAYVAEGSMTPQDAERILQPRPWYASVGWLGCSTKNNSAADA